ncbi:hypothetical protein [Synechococcus sp. BMK-MC-1]|uniref:hypothetical protein n=1 Tax=Synechococcus sp. BMK-MC-1 TaxID=1442551 RepID=UPI0016475156|nr:hypothetical protein [Synechococcus sp. BMK-MC-1]
MRRAAGARRSPDPSLGLVRSPGLANRASVACRRAREQLRSADVARLVAAEQHLVLLSSHQAAHRSGIAGSTLAACVQVWRLPAAFDAEQVLAPEPPELNAAWQREALAEAFVDALIAAQPSVWCGESWRGCGGDEKEFAAGETAESSLLVFEVCVYTHMPLPRDAGHGFGLGVVVGVCPCSMDGCTVLLVRPTCRSVRSVQNSRGPKAPLLCRATARELFRRGELAAASASSVVVCPLALGDTVDAAER